MTAKQLRFYQILKSVNTLNFFTDNKKLLDCIKQAIALDYYAAIELWEFLILDNEEKLTKDIPLASVICDKIAEVFESKAGAKYAKTITENPAICAAAYQYSPSCFVREESINLIAGYLASAKTEQAGDILSCAYKNTSNKVSLGDFMKAVIEKLYIEMLKKSSDGKIRLSRKVLEQLLDYVGKLKGPEKALLTQRLKEVQ